MRDNSTASPDSRDMRDPNHIWLRQSVTFSVNGQTRTLEMALPLRPGATPDEVDALLDEADAGMRRLSQRLDAHLAEVTGSPASISPIIAPAASRASTPPTTPATPEAPHEASRHVTPQPPMPAPEAQPAPAPTPMPQPTSAEERPAPRPAPTPTRPLAAAPTTPAASASGGPDLTRPEFLAAVGALGLNARTVMERLNVRTLNGLNLRETLDLLRRQMLREGGAPAEAAPAPTMPPSARVEAQQPAPIGAARFDEEDDGPDFELSYPDPDDLPSEDDFAEDELAEEEFAPPVATSAGPLGDVPDLDDLLASPTASTTPSPAASGTPATDASAPAPDPDAPTRELIAGLRAHHPGGQATGQQRTAYQNMIVGELGEKKAAGIVRALWDLTPEKLGPEQYDALIRWGKQDTFADEVEAVLEVLRADYRAQQAAQQAAQQGETQPATPAAPARRPAQEAAQEAPEAQQAAPAAPAKPAPRGRPAASRASNAPSGANGEANGRARHGAGSQGGA